MAQARPFTRWDVAILAASALVGLAMAFATDLEYQERFGASPAFIPGEPTRLPVWVKMWRHNAIRTVYDTASALSMLSLGLALATFRPRLGTPRRRRRRLGPGHILSAVAALAVLAVVGHWGLDRIWPDLASPWAMMQRGRLPFVGFYQLLMQWLSPITSVVLGAWFCLLVSGWRRRPVDSADRLGRWLGWGWVALLFGQGVIYVLAWS